MQKPSPLAGRIVNQGPTPVGVGSATEIVQVPFHGTYLHTAMGDDGEPIVILKPTVIGMGLDWSAQLKKLKTRSWAVVAETATTGPDGKTYDVASCGLDTWSMLLANIDENRVKPSVKDLVIAYQQESARVLRDYWTKGAATSPAIPAFPATLPDALRAYADELEAHGKTREELDHAKPFADAYLDLMDADGTFEWAVVAQIFWSITGGLGRNNFLELLRSDELKVLKRNNTPYQVHGADRRFKVTPHRSGPDADATTRVTPEGLDWLRGRLLKHFNRQEPLFVIGALA